MTAPFTAALVQMTSGPSVDENLAAVAAHVGAAAASGAALVCLPETCTRMQPDRKKLLAEVRPAHDDPAVDALKTLAESCGVWLAVGSHAALAEDTGGAGGPRAANRSLLISPAGAVAASYDKIHLFDVALDTGETHRESDTYAGGARAVLAETPLGRIGLTVCYDLRFPGLYQGLARAGAEIILVPAAFTRPTGEAHWEILLRARAVETGCYVLAAAQCGEHAGGRKTWGHSLAADPWGRVLADGGETPGVTLVEIDPGAVGAARRQIPNLWHARAYEGP
ncbi:MAG: carbon-nitrogen hydrolase family protein [Rhodospirillales bacterium]